jgi:hypothetical protein
MNFNLNTNGIQLKKILCFKLKQRSFLIRIEPEFILLLDRREQF